MLDETAKADVGETKIEDHPQYQALHNEHTALKFAHESLKDDHNRLKKDHDHLHNRVAELNGRLNEVHQKTLADEKGAKMAEADTEDTSKEMAELKAAVARLEGEVNTLKSAKASLENENKALADEKAELAKANDAQEATLEAFRKASRHSERAEALMVADTELTREKALENVKAFDELSNAGFAAMVELMKGYASRAPKEVSPKDVINNAKADADANINYGAQLENKHEKVTADVKKFIKGTGRKGQKGE